MGFIIATAVIRSDANLVFRRSLSVYLIVKGKVKIDEQYKEELARTMQAKVVQLNRAALISV